MEAVGGIFFSNIQVGRGWRKHNQPPPNLEYLRLNVLNKASDYMPKKLGKEVSE